MSLWCFFLQVQLELRETTEQRDCLLVELQEKTAKLEEQIGRNSNRGIHFEFANWRIFESCPIYACMPVSIQSAKFTSIK